MIQLSHLSIATGKIISSVQLCPTLWESMDGSTPGLPAHHQLPELTQIHIHGDGDANQPSIFHHSSLWHSAFFIVQLSYPYMTPGNSIALTGQNCACIIMFLHFKMLSQLFITFLPRSKHLLISRCSHNQLWFWSPKQRSVTVSPPICHEVMGPDAMILVFWMLSFKSTFLLYSFIFIKRLFNSSSLSAIRVVSFAYMRLLIFLLAILIPACASSSPAFLRMYST